MRTDSSHEVGKLINYFENYINDLNKDLTTNSQQPVRTTSQNTSHLTLTFETSPQPISTILPTIIDDENVYDQLTYQTLIHTNSYSSPEQLSIKSSKRRRSHFNSHHHTSKKRLYRRRPPPPTYIKELKAYLAHRETSTDDIAKISDVKKFSNVLVWLSNQTKSPSITPDSVIEITESFSDPPSALTTNTSITHLTYDKVTWKLKIRKEVFSPIETFDEPLLIDLLYLQILYDIFSTVCIRISEAERTNMKIFLSSHGVLSIADIKLINTISIKKNIIDQARQWSIYFCRFFPISSNETQILGVSHLGIRFIKRNENLLQIFETFSFDMIQRISLIEDNSKIEIHSTKKLMTVYSQRAKKIYEMIDKYLKEFRVFAPTPSELVKSSSQISLMSCSPISSEVEISTPKSPGYSMMEFAVQNFQIPDRRRSKKGWKTLEWTWQDYTELLKWSKIPISTPLLRHTSNNIARIARQCFIAIMRFMGDYIMARSQNDIDCLYYLLKTLYKHRTLIDEIFCQIIKQLTDNKSTKTDSIERGWKLLTILLNYFIPNEYLQPYVVKYLHENRNQNQKLVQLCLNHYEQTFKYSGRKTNPSKEEIDLLTANGRNGGKRQTFLLPGGFPLTLLTTSSMIIDDCLKLLCEHFKILNTFENDEYSIFIISNSEHTSRLLNPTEYLFDILNDCIQSKIINYHLIIKRILWFTIPFQFDINNQSEIYINFIYHQLLPEFLEGIMIILKNDYFSEEFIEEISFLAALQYRASHKIGLPSMKEVKHLLPASIVKLKNVRPQKWTDIIHEKLRTSVESMSIPEAKIKFLSIKNDLLIPSNTSYSPLDLIQTWPLFGTTFYTVQSTNDSSIRTPCLIGVNKTGILFLDSDTREILFEIIYHSVESIRRHQMIVDIKYRNLNQENTLQCQIEKAQELVILTGRYLKLIDRQNKTKE